MTAPLKFDFTNPANVIQTANYVGRLSVSANHYMISRFFRLIVEFAKGEIKEWRYELREKSKEG